MNRIRFKPFASILAGMFIIGIAVGFLIGYYIHEQSHSNFWMYVSAPCLGLGSGLVMYGTLYGRDIN